MSTIVFIKYYKSICFKPSFKSPFEKPHLFHDPFLNHLQPLLLLLKAKTAFQTMWTGLPKAGTLSCFHAFRSGESG